MYTGVPEFLYSLRCSRPSFVSTAFPIIVEILYSPFGAPFAPITPSTPFPPLPSASALRRLSFFAVSF